MLLDMHLNKRFSLVQVVQARSVFFFALFWPFLSIFALDLSFRIGQEEKSRIKWWSSSFKHTSSNQKLVEKTYCIQKYYSI